VLAQQACRDAGGEGDVNGGAAGQAEDKVGPPQLQTDGDAERCDDGDADRGFEPDHVAERATRAIMTPTGLCWPRNRIRSLSRIGASRANGTARWAQVTAVAISTAASR
jgi:hypothetical protein